MQKVLSSLKWNWGTYFFSPRHSILWRPHPTAPRKEAPSAFPGFGTYINIYIYIYIYILYSSFLFLFDYPNIPQYCIVVSISMLILLSISCGGPWLSEMRGTQSQASCSMKAFNKLFGYQAKIVVCICWKGFGMHVALYNALNGGCDKKATSM